MGAHKSGDITIPGGVNKVEAAAASATFYSSPSREGLIKLGQL